MDCRNGFCTAEAGRCLLRTLPRKLQVPYAAEPWAGITAFEIPIASERIEMRHPYDALSEKTKQSRLAAKPTMARINQRML